MTHSDNYLVIRPTESSTPVLSSLTGAVRLYVESKFPHGYFNDYNVSTLIPNAKLKVFKKSPKLISHTEALIQRRKLPLLSINVEPSWEPSPFNLGDEWFKNYRFPENIDSTLKLYYDPDKYIKIGYTNNRYVYKFTINLVLETELKVYDVAKYLKEILPFNFFTHLNMIQISSQIPTQILNLLWFYTMGINADTNDKSLIAYFDDRIKKISNGAIEPLINSATGRKEYSHKFLSNIIMKIENGISTNINRNGSIVKNAQLGFSIILDAPIPDVYYARSQTFYPKDFETGIFSKTRNSAYIQLSTPLDIPDLFDDGLKLFKQISIITGEYKDPTQDDVTDLSSEIDPYYKKFILYLNSLKKLKFVLWKNNIKIDPTLFTFDLETFKLTIKMPYHKRHKHIFTMYGDTSLMSDFLNSEVDKKFREQAEFSLVNINKVTKVPL